MINPIFDYDQSLLDGILFPISTRFQRFVSTIVNNSQGNIHTRETATQVGIEWSYVYAAIFERFATKLLSSSNQTNETRSSIFPRKPRFSFIHPSRSFSIFTEARKVPAFFGQLTISFKWHIWSTVLLDAGIPAVIFLPRRTTV